LKRSSGFVQGSAHPANVMKMRACLTTGRYRPAHNNTETLAATGAKRFRRPQPVRKSLPPPKSPSITCAPASSSPAERN
ncbi:hypothetical protein, partial [Pseudomonas sp. WSY_20]|uniref:hypothetical protein n=1 Tax=Pseudomonas sp. WSY_20 TaxID=3367212 RepID=UPI00370BF2B1